LNLEHHRKEAKRLRRAYADGEPEAVARGSAALGDRAGARFLLSDAQHVIAVEHGYRSWPDLKRAVESTPVEIIPEHDRSETILETGLQYRPGEPVLVRVSRREHRIEVSDDGAAFEKAGRAQTWQTAADRVLEQYIVNISRHGVISLPVMPLGQQQVVQRIAEASLALYQEILDLEG
jgi:hypothetical protein